MNDDCVKFTTIVCKKEQCGHLPHCTQRSATSAAASAKAADVDVTKQFLAYLMSPAAADSMRKSGLDLPDTQP